MHHEVATRISEVTVYPDRARLVRRGEVELESGVGKLIVDELPLTLDRDSVRARGRGSAAVRILGLDVARSHFTGTPAAAVHELEQRVEAAEDELGLLDDRRASLEADRGYVDGLRGATREYARALAWGRMTVEQGSDLARSLGERDREVRGQLHALAVERREAERRLDKLRRELAEHQAERPRERLRATVEVEVTSAGSFELELMYVVSAASWQPLYDVRLTGGDDEPQLEVTYQAQVSQRSGEEWSDVQLSVSTARPALTQRVPELRPWFVGVRSPPAAVMARARAMPAPAAAAVTLGSADAGDAVFAAAELDDAIEVLEADDAPATATTGDLAIGFQAPGRTDVPSDGSPRKVTLARVELQPTLDHLCVPRHTPAVYRRARVRNDGPGPLLAGPVNLFVGDEFIGATRIDYTARGAELELLLGVEEGIEVERELLKKDVDKRLLRDKRQLRHAYRIELENLMERRARVLIKDQIPVSRHEGIKVKLERVEPKPEEHTDLNILEWNLELEPGAKPRIEFEFLVEHSTSFELAGL